MMSKKPNNEFDMREFWDAIEFLIRYCSKNEPQFNPQDPNYCGFINMGFDMFLFLKDRKAFKYVVENIDLFVPFLEKFGLEVQCCDINETIIGEISKKRLLLRKIEELEKKN